MNQKILLSLALVLLAPFRDAVAGGPVAAGKPQKLVHDWEYIDFATTAPYGKEPVFSAGFAERQGGYKSGFRVDILNLPRDFFKTPAIAARLYRANGEVVEPTDEGKRSLKDPVEIDGAKGSEGLPQVMTWFPWGKNVLEECWVEVSLGTERYWLEVPYGFDRNPNDPLPPPNAEGRPKIVPAMKTLTAHDHVVPWESVHYEIGEIQHGWRLALIQSNPADAGNPTSKLELYQENGGWDLEKPHTALRVVNAGGAAINGTRAKAFIDEDGMDRNDLFTIPRNGLEKTRRWGRIEISVDDKSYRVIVPSSVYESTHGHAAIK